MHHTYMAHTDRATIPVVCDEQTDPSSHRAYPVLQIGDATFFPSVAQLETLHEVIGKYLGKHMPTPQTAPIDQETSDFLLGNHEPQEVASGG